MGSGESSMPSLLSFKEDNLCQKPSSTKLCIGANCSRDPFRVCPAMTIPSSFSSSSNFELSEVSINWFWIYGYFLILKWQVEF